MSTRTNVLIKTPEQTIYLYRHCDGYPEVTGRNLKEIINKKHWDCCDLATYLIQYHERLKWSSEDYYPYELTYCIHGDIEFLYVIEILKDATKLTAYAVHGFDRCAEDIIKPENIVDIPE